MLSQGALGRSDTILSGSPGWLRNGNIVITAAPTAPTPKPPGAPLRRRPRQDSELFFDYTSAGSMMREEHGPAVPELSRRMTVCSCDADPARALVPVLTAMPRGE